MGKFLVNGDVGFSWGLCRARWGLVGVLGSPRVSSGGMLLHLGLCLQKYPEHAIHKVLQLMLRRGEVQHRMQRKVLYRLK